MQPSEFTLLVVDDNPENREILARRLERKGFTVLEAEGGQQALDVIAHSRVDLVLLDIMMPGMSGLEVLKILRGSPQTADLPVVMQTAKSESDDVVEALGLGASDYVTKPLDFPVVLARVQAQLRLRRVARPSEVSPGPAPAPGPGPGEIGPGVVLAERYRLDSKIGAGNFGTVYKARHLDLDRPVAVKVLQASVARKPEAIVRFRREGISACRIRHANAVAVLDFGVTAEGVAYLVMELLDGHSLLEELEQRQVLAPRRAIEILIPVCAALAEAHASGVVHRDIKPSNIFLQRSASGEVPKVLDFGIAKISGEGAGGPDLTLQGAVLGTLAYMAPERFGTAPIDGKADVYSLGVTLYQLLTGRQPFTAPEGEPMALIMAHMNDTPRPLREWNPSLPAPLEAAVLQALRKKPEQRPSAVELARNLARALDLPLGTAPAPAAPGAPADAATAVSVPEAPTLQADFTPLDAPTEQPTLRETPDASRDGESRARPPAQGGAKGR